MESYCSMCAEFQFGKDEKVLNMDGSYGSTTMWMYLMLLTGNLKVVKKINFMLCMFNHNKNKKKKKGKENGPVTPFPVPRALSEPRYSPIKRWSLYVPCPWTFCVPPRDCSFDCLGQRTAEVMLCNCQDSVIEELTASAQFSVYFNLHLWSPTCCRSHPAGETTLWVTER